MLGSSNAPSVVESSALAVREVRITTTTTIGRKREDHGAIIARNLDIPEIHAGKFMGSLLIGNPHA